ncbi:hypothetical protein DsansV1_C40g0237071 [Dioscorea sansibarensis]
MVFSAFLHPILSLSGRPYPNFNYCCLTHTWKQGLLVLPEAQRRNHLPFEIKSILGKLNSNITQDDDAVTDPAKVTLERVFMNTQKLEKEMVEDSIPTVEDTELNTNIEIVESNLQRALSALMKEQDLQDAEKRVLLDHAKLDQTKQDLEIRVKDIMFALAKQRKMEEDLKKANDDLASQSMQIEELKVLVEEQEKKIANSRSALSQKEDDLERLRDELVKKSEEAKILNTVVQSKNHIISEANKMIREQEAEIKVLERKVSEKEQNLAESLQLKNKEEENLKSMESILEKQTIKWLSAQKELEELKIQASKNMNDVKVTSEYFERVQVLLANVRSELISSQESLAISRRKLEDQAQQLESQLMELSEQKLLLTSYSETLKDAQLDIEDKRSRLTAARAESKELEIQLLENRELIEKLQGELTEERAAVESGIQEIALLQKKLLQKEWEYFETQKLLQARESQLLEAQIQIQHMESEQASLQLIVKEKDADLEDARKTLAHVNDDISELQVLMNTKEAELMEATTKLLEKEDHVLMMQNDLGSANYKLAEATSIVERIANLTNTLVVDGHDNDDTSAATMMNDVCQMPEMMHETDPRKLKQLVTLLQMTRQSLEAKETDFLAAQRALKVKDEELKAVLRRWEVREKEFEKMKKELLEDAGGLTKLYCLSQERIRDKTLGHLAIEKLEVEAAQLEAKAATSAVRKLAELTKELLGQNNTSIELVKDFEINAVSCDNKEMRTGGFEEAGRELAHLFALTEKLVKDAGISDTELLL